MVEPLKQIELPKGFGSTRGSEHEVWLHGNGERIIKATHPGEFGRKFGPDRFASFEEYLKRIEMTVIEFGIDWRIEGVWGAGKSMRVVTSQPAFFGTPPSLKAIGQYLRHRDFILHRSRFGDAWFRKVDGILIADAEPKNAASTDKGIIPFDFLISRPSPDLLSLAEIY